MALCGLAPGFPFSPWSTLLLDFPVQMLPESQGSYLPWSLHPVREEFKQDMNMEAQVIVKSIKRGNLV
jgi:hypothetical protein